MQGGLAAALASGSMPQAVFGLAEPAEGEELIPFLDPQPVNEGRSMVEWQTLRAWRTPDEDFFSVSHYGLPEKMPDPWTLEVTGLVDRPKSFTLDDLKARPRRERIMTLECSGNGVSDKFQGAIGNMGWAGTPLGPILKECGLKPEGIEIVFFAADQSVEKIRDNDYPQHFARSLSLDDAMDDRVLLCYEMNGKPLTFEHGHPVRLLVPGWYGIANVKWLTRIEVHDRRFMGKFMARDYVTLRGEKRGDETIWRETSVGRMNIKSMIGRVVRRKDGSIRVHGAAWNDGTPFKAVELKIDEGQWAATHIDRTNHEKYGWTFWSYDWNKPVPGKHTLVCRASDTKGRVQPTADDPRIALKKTYWEANEQLPREIEV
jgi:DMSO/TMAO reductase YedYZ molybdopterin-dependent catalytic subunit